MPPALTFFYFAFLYARGGLLNDIDMYIHHMHGTCVVWSHKGVDDS